MIRIRRAGDVTQLAMARTVFGRPLYVACAYYIDGLLLDNGPSIVEGEFARLFAQLEVRQAVLSRPFLQTEPYRRVNHRGRIELRTTPHPGPAPLLR